MQRTFTRQELYDLVWSTPIVTLAERFQKADRGLAKICAAVVDAFPIQHPVLRIRADRAERFAGVEI